MLIDKVSIGESPELSDEAGDCIGHHKERADDSDARTEEECDPDDETHKDAFAESLIELGGVSSGNEWFEFSGEKGIAGENAGEETIGGGTHGLAGEGLSFDELA